MSAATWMECLDDCEDVATAFEHRLGPWHEDADWQARQSLGERTPYSPTYLYATCTREGCTAWARVFAGFEDHAVWLGINARCPWSPGIVRVP